MSKSITCSPKYVLELDIIFYSVFMKVLGIQETGNFELSNDTTLTITKVYLEGWGLGGIVHNAKWAFRSYKIFIYFFFG